MDESEIKTFCTTLKDFHQQRVEEQIIDQTYYNDTFAVGIVKPFHVVRTGSAARLVDNIVAHIETCNPQVFREPKRKSESSRDSAIKVSRLLNYWAKRLVPEITESVWNAVLRGEGIFQVQFNNEAYRKEEGKGSIYIPDMMPVLITSPDPATVFCYPYDALLPTQVVKSFSLSKTLANQLFPDMGLGKKKRKKDEHSPETVDYLAYYDANSRYLEIHGQSIDDEGVQTNILGFCPFVHYYAGFGKRSPDGAPESLAVGRLRKVRGTLVEECELESRIDSIIALYANPLLVLREVATDAGELPQKSDTIVMGPGATIELPYGWDFKIYVPEVSSPQLFAYLNQVQARLGLENPPIMSGIASSSRVSGRQEDIEFGHIAKKYEKLVSNLERALEAVFGRCLQILDTVPQALPITIRGEVREKGQTVIKEEEITKEDIDGYYECTVKLNPEEDLEDDRNFMKYRILVNEGRISWLTFLIEGCNKTEWEAQEIIAQAIAEVAVRDDPLMSAARTQEALERMGMERYLKKAQSDEEMHRRMQEELGKYNPQGGGQFRPSEATNPAALDTARQLLGGETPGGIRRPPTPQQGVSA